VSTAVAMKNTPAAIARISVTGLLRGGAGGPNGPGGAEANPGPLIGTGPP
jgi:hypothetical protein